MLDVIDDTLVLDFKDGRRRTKALSVSAIKQYKEDPQAFYLGRILRVKEPQGLPMAFGDAMHTGMQTFGRATADRTNAAHVAFDAAMRGKWDQVEDRSERFNPAKPWFASDKVETVATLDSTLARGHGLLENLRMLEAGWQAYTPTQLMTPTERVELRVGDVAKERGMPYAQMDLFDPQLMKMVRGMNVAVVAGVPVYGYIDWIPTWTDGEPAIIDHKFVGHIISYYEGGRSYAPSYNPANDLQLDVYSTATGITRAGFQYFTKLPQYVPASGVLFSGWMDERAWKATENPGFFLPMAWSLDARGELHYVLVWRPSPADHRSRPSMYLPDQIAPRTWSALRTAAESITESILMLERGVDPKIAFPAGDPKELAKKSCPFCYFAKQGLCAGRTSRSAAGAYQNARSEREAIAATIPDIIERRQIWQAYRKSSFAC